MAPSDFVIVKFSLNDYNYDYDYFRIFFIRLRLRLRNRLCNQRGNRLYNRRDYTSLEGTTFWTYWELLGFKSNDFTLKILFLWIFDEGNLRKRY